MERFLPSFGRRKARKLRPLSQQAYQQKISLVKITDELPLFEPSSDDIWLEIGFGGGEHLLAQLASNPSIKFVGCEPFMNGIAKLLMHLSGEDLHRVRLWLEDVRYLLDKVPSSYFSRAFILFPDPWPKMRQHKRRLISPEFVAQLLRTLKEKAILYVASDDPTYVHHIQQVLSAFPELQLREGPSSAEPCTWGARPHDWPPTRYEQKALVEGKPCAYMIFQKIK